MNKIFSTPNNAIYLACISWLLLYLAALFALGNPKPVSPTVLEDSVRIEFQVKKKNIAVRAIIGVSILSMVTSAVIGAMKWTTAKIRLSFSLLICAVYVGLFVFTILIS